MRYNRLGRTGLFVSELCFGTMTFGGSDGMWKQIGSLQQADADRLIGVAHEAGIISSTRQTFTQRACQKK
jgi:aryl-alcohol dehydrogenase-like predicted oxidoreductase